MKTCSTCGVTKPRSEFYRDKTRPDGLKYGCKECRAKYSKEWHAKNRERLSQAAIEWRKKNKERFREVCAAWNERNPEKRRQFAVDWRAKNRAHHNAYKAKRRAEKRQRTPAWADMETIKDFYAEANYFGMEVDHIVPLKSDLVCGLHVEHNLQLLTPFENASKKNRFWPDMP